jgi:hypothetical protein
MDPNRRQLVGGIVWMLSTVGSLRVRVLLHESLVRWSAEL